MHNMIPNIHIDNVENMQVNYDNYSPKTKEYNNMIETLKLAKDMPNTPQHTFGTNTKVNEPTSVVGNRAGVNEVDYYKQREAALLEQEDGDIEDYWFNVENDRRYHRGIRLFIAVVVFLAIMTAIAAIGAYQAQPVKYHYTPKIEKVVDAWYNDPDYNYFADSDGKIIARSKK